MSVDSFAPAAIARLEITEPLHVLDPSRPLDHLAESAIYEHYVRAEVLVTIHHRPIGVVSIDTTEVLAHPETFAAAIERELGDEIAKHLSPEGINSFKLTVDGLVADGLVKDSEWRLAPCWAPPLPENALPLISIVVATSNRSGELHRCISRMLEVDYPNFEIVIVDNGSNDDSTKNMYYENFANDANVKFISLPEPGVSRARNIGCNQATGEIIAFTDDDVYPDRNWLYALARQFTTHRSVACVTGLVFPASFDHQAQQWFEEYGGFNKGYEARIYGRRRRKGLTALYPYTAGAFGSGNNAAFRKKEFLELGGFDETIGPGTITPAGEDLDAFLAIIMGKFNISYEPAAIIYHYHRDNYPALRKQLFNYGLGLSALFAKWSLRSPKYALEILLRAPLGVWVVINPKSAKNRKKSASFPTDLTVSELKGMVIGPIVYVSRKFWQR